MQEGVASPVGHAAAPVRLPALTIVQTLPAKCSLVDTTILQTAERHPNVLKLVRENEKIGTRLTDYTHITMIVTLTKHSPIQ